MSTYSIYLVRCRDGSLYTGISTDVTRRLNEHRNGRRGAKYLKGKSPITLLYEQEIGDRSLASRIEARIRKMPSTVKGDVDRLPERIDGFLKDLTDQ